MSGTRRPPFLPWALVLMPSIGAVTVGIAVPALGVGLLVFILTVAVTQVVQRRRRRRDAAPGGPRRWEGHVPAAAFAVFWPRGLPTRSLRVWTTMPVALEATPDGLVLRPRGWLFSRSTAGRAIEGTCLAWSDVTGAQEQALGRTDGEGHVSFVPLTRVGIGVVGLAGMPPVLGGDAPAEVGPRRHARIEQGALLGATAGDTWVPGTVPLVVVTSCPDRLVHTVRRHARGEPVEPRRARRGR